MNAHSAMPDLLTVDFPNLMGTLDQTIPIGKNYGEVRYNNKLVGFVTQEVGNKNSYQPCRQLSNAPWISRV